MESPSLFADILKLTKMTFDEINQSKLSIRKILYYDLYRALHTMNRAIYVTLEHYLALTFEESFLVETISFNSGTEKWRNVLNEDLTRTTCQVQVYLKQLQYLSYDDEDDNLGSYIMQKRPLDNYIEHKNFYGSLARYTCGFIPDESYILERMTINLQSLKKDPLVKTSVDLSTYEQRLQVKEEGLAILKQLIAYEKEMKMYLMSTTSVKDLMVEEQLLKK